MIKKDQHLPEVRIEKIDSEKKAAEAVDILREAVRFHDYRYYVLNDPTISEKSTTNFFKPCRNWNKPGIWLLSDSPTQKVAGEPVEELGTIRHSTPMMSLKAVYEEAGVRDFAKTCRQSGMGQSEVEFVTEPKYDGLSIELVYLNGKLEQAATRGDGDDRRRCHSQCPDHRRGAACSYDVGGKEGAVTPGGAW